MDGWLAVAFGFSAVAVFCTGAESNANSSSMSSRQDRVSIRILHSILNVLLTVPSFSWYLSLGIFSAFWKGRWSDPSFWTHIPSGSGFAASTPVTTDPLNNTNPRLFFENAGTSGFSNTLGSCWNATSIWVRENKTRSIRYNLVDAHLNYLPARYLPPLNPRVLLYLRCAAPIP